MTRKAVIAVLILVVVVFAIQFLSKQAVGCTDGLRDVFVNSSLARAYVNEYTQYMRDAGVKLENEKWDIDRSDVGCVVQYSATMSNSYPKRHYTADSFLINPNTWEVYPQSDGAREFAQVYTGSWKLR